MFLVEIARRQPQHYTNERPRVAIQVVRVWRPFTPCDNNTSPSTTTTLALGQVAMSVAYSESELPTWNRVVVTDE